MDLQLLLDEAPQSPPCGPDLEYDAAFLALESAAQSKPEVEVAGTVVAAVEPEWPAVYEQAAALLARSKDLRIAMQLLRALTRTRQLSGFVTGLALINGLLERYWDSGLYPLLDAEDNNDPTLRLNALAPLEGAKGSAAVETLLRDLREAAVVPPTAKARVLVRDVLIADGKLAASGSSLGDAAIDAALGDSFAADASLAEVPAQALAAVRQMRSFIAEKVGSERAPDIDAAVQILAPVAHRCARLTGAAEPDEGGADAGSPAGPAGVGGPIRSREDVVRAIDAICAYLERTEPANPAPLLLRRAQRLLHMSFVDLIKDLAPDGVAQVKLIAGLGDED
jgi:type VI secretion system protein ImpA